MAVATKVSAFLMEVGAHVQAVPAWPKRSASPASRLQRCCCCCSMCAGAAASSC